MSKKTLVVSIASGLIALAVQPMSAATPSLAGSWQFTLTATTCCPTCMCAVPTNAPAAVAIPGLATFTADGSVIETNGSEFAMGEFSRTAAKASTSGHGIWQLANTPERLYVQYISLVLEPDGALFARNVTTMFLSLNSAGTTFTGTYTTAQMNGTLARVLSSGTVTGQLIPHVPLP